MSTLRRLAPRAVLVVALLAGAGADRRRTATPPVAPARPVGVARPQGDPGPTIGAAYGRLPLHFERNEGQADGRVRYLARGAGYGLFLTADAAVLTLRHARRHGTPDYGSAPEPDRDSEAPPDERPAVVRARLVGARPDVDMAGEELLAGHSNYFIGNDRSRWRTDVPHFGRVTYRAVWPGIDLSYYGNQRQLEYDFVVAPGADPGVIRLAYEGVEGMSVDASGNLILRTGGGELVQRAPLVYQQVEGQRREVEGRFVLAADGRVGFGVGPFDRALPLVIDPVLVYSTYLGGSDWENGTGVATDAGGNAYVTGCTYSTDFPMVNPYQAHQGGSVTGTGDAFVTKLSANGNSLVYSTYLGGSGDEGTNGIAVDAGGSAYVTGSTDSTDFPTHVPYQSQLAGSSDVFVTKLSPNGNSLAYSTYLGGSAVYNGSTGEYVRAIAVDAAGSTYVTGSTRSADFPTQGPYQASLMGPRDAFVTKLSASGNSLAYSTYLGGSGSDTASGIAVDGTGTAYVMGSTNSTDFPTQGPYQNRLAGSSDGFVTKLSASGSSLAYSTYLGGSGLEVASGIAVDGTGSVYVTGSTDSTDFPTLGPYQNHLAGSDDVFVTKLSASGNSLVYSTYLGGSGSDTASGIAVDRAGSAWATGATWSANFPTRDSLRTFQGGGSDAFVTELSVDGSSLAYSTYIGGGGPDEGLGLALDSTGNAYVTGITSSADFPTQGPYQSSLKGVSDLFVTKLAADPPPGLDFYTLTPCRLLDTRDPPGTFGGPALVPGADRVFPLRGQCGIPSTARAVSVNLTVTQPTTVGNIRLYPAGIPLPLVSSVNYSAGLTRANNAVVALNANGDLAVRCTQSTGTAHFVLDVNGYFQ